MKLVVVREIEKLLHRPNVQPKTQLVNDGI